jgi:hypothetical protein
MLIRAIVWLQTQRLADHEDVERGDVIQTVIIAAAVAVMALAAMASISLLVNGKIGTIKL